MRNTPTVRWPWFHLAGVCRKNDAANSTDSHFCGINSRLHFLENIRTENLKGESESVSNHCNSLFQPRNSLFRQNPFPVPCRKIPCYFPGVHPQIETRKIRDSSP